MSLEDFCRNFHELNVCRNVNNPVFGRKELESVVGCWTVNDDPLMNRSGGCYNNRDTFLQNPQVWTKFFLSSSYQGSRASLVVQTVKNLPTMQETWVQSLGQRSPGKGSGNPLQYSCLENSMDRRCKQSNTTEQLTLALFTYQGNRKPGLTLECFFDISSPTGHYYVIFINQDEDRWAQMLVKHSRLCLFADM